ncbi:MAG: tRNA (adenosine(37)-N6)-dimethylallyltransferase MiaA [Ferruginibacter sp.]|nr:tRNA (adenosine(37)-N6)-dimethylallyltransferase MiaA [Ferruginibacter sp.]
MTNNLQQSSQPTFGNKTCIVIAGPTAVGKTSFAIQLAQQLNTQIISADSRQCFKELNIGVAKPSPEQLQQVKHYFINSHSVSDEVNAVVFEQYALQKVNEIFAQHNTAVMVGGTGLYIKAFSNGIDAVPAVDIAIREKIIADYELQGLEWLQTEVQKNDSAYFTKGEIKNPQRLMRALEVKLSSGQSILDFQTQQKKQRDFNIIKLGLELPKEELYKNINSRVDEMIVQGLTKEVEALYQYKNLNALQTVGYKELFDYADGVIPLEKAVEQIKLNTRHYAKRQMTWFKKDVEMKWVSPHLPVSAVLEEISLGK